MKIAVLGTGSVGNTLGSKLVQEGNEVMMGSRNADNPKAVEWVSQAGATASAGTFADAAAFGDIIINCTMGMAALDALKLAGSENMAGKIVIDVSNPLDFSNGFPPILSVCNTESLGEQIQRKFPEARVVKALNTMTASVMADPSLVPGDHNVFMGGNDISAKEEVAGHLEEWFGWKRDNIIDLGDITTARGIEMILPLWVRLYAAMGSAVFNFHVVTGPHPARTPTSPRGRG